MEPMFIFFSGTKEEWEKKLEEEVNINNNNINDNQSRKERRFPRI